MTKGNLLELVTIMKKIIIPELSVNSHKLLILIVVFMMMPYPTENMLKLKLLIPQTISTGFKVDMIPLILLFKL